MSTAKEQIQKVLEGGLAAEVVSDAVTPVDETMSIDLMKRTAKIAKARIKDIDKEIKELEKANPPVRRSAKRKVPARNCEHVLLCTVCNVRLCNACYHEWHGIN